MRMLIVMILGSVVVCPGSIHADAPMIETYLQTGQSAKGEAALIAHLKQKPADSQAQFGLGFLQFIQAIEHLGQGLYRYGPRTDHSATFAIPILRLPVPTNPKPEQATYEALQRMLLDFQADLARAESSLARVKDSAVKLPIHLLRIRLDFDNNGVAETELRGIVERYVRGGSPLPKDLDLRVDFDRGDVDWLRGYCHLLTGISEVMLAHDGQELMDTIGFLLFYNVKTPHEFLKHLKPEQHWWGLGNVDVIDLIAFAHQVLKLPLKEPARMKSALEHFEKVFALSKTSWAFIQAETDSENEWLPNPNQTGPLGVRLTKEQIKTWLEFVDEMNDLLAGKRLIPFWRGDFEKRGVNLRKVFLEPRTFDVILWVQGTGAAPYLEKGEMTRPGIWNNIQRVFGGDFFGFALWFN